jgi:hypothetical protein
MFPRNIWILLPTEVASYPRRGPVQHCSENLKTDGMSSLAKWLLNASIIEFTVSYTMCPTGYRNRHEDIATKFEQEYVRCLRNEEECVCSGPNYCDTEQQYPH